MMLRAVMTSTSFVLMRELSLTQVFTSDQHFSILGFMLVS